MEMNENEMGLIKTKYSLKLPHWNLYLSYKSKIYTNFFQVELKAFFINSINICKIFWATLKAEITSILFMLTSANVN